MRQKVRQVDQALLMAEHPAFKPVLEHLMELTKTEPSKVEIKGILDSTFA